MFLLEVHHGLFSDNFSLVAQPHTGWTLITSIDQNFPARDASGNALTYTQDQVFAACPLLREAGTLNDPEFETFIHLIHAMLNTAQSGQDWPTVMTKAVHDAGDVVITRNSGKHEKYSIVQFGKKKTMIRIHTFTSAIGRKVAFISHVFEKPKNSDKTPSKEQTRAEINLQQFLNAVDVDEAQFIDTQGGKDGLNKLVRRTEK
jgi:hypothetical protein